MTYIYWTRSDIMRNSTVQEIS